MWKECIEALGEGQEVRQNLIQLKEMLREDGQEEAFMEALGGGSVFSCLLKDEDPKVRKNAAQALGLLAGRMDSKLSAKEEGEIEQSLFAAYEAEQTLFVRAAYLKAMQNVCSGRYMDQLRERHGELLRIEPASPEADKKHLRQERKELEALLREGSRLHAHAFCAPARVAEVFLTTERGFAAYTAEQIRSGRAEVFANGVRVTSGDFEALCAIRTYREMLFPIHAARPLQADGQVADSLLGGNLMQLLQGYLRGGPPYYFRIEEAPLPGQEKNADFIKKVAFALEEGSQYQLSNAKDHYEVEIRLVQNKKGGYTPFLKFYALPLHRFSYRRNVVASSIQPSLAALLVWLAKPYLKENAAVLDPFCGVGTMLLERERAVPARSLYGVDIFGEAIQGARENTALAGAQAFYVRKDFFDFTHRHRFDEIITDMPVRGRKSKAEQDALFQGFFERAPRILEKGGVIVMYTNENGFVKKQLRLHKNLELLKEYCIRPKGEWFLFIIGVR